MKIDITENDLKLIKEALTNNSVQYASNSIDKINVVMMGKEWASKQMQKSDDMIELLNKI